MALTTQPGFSGFTYGRVSSMDQRAIGKFTDANHLEALRQEAPSDYDKKIISIYTQSGLYANDFQQMLDQSTPYYLDGVSDTWQWEVEVPFTFPQIIDVPSDTILQDRVGIDGHEFQFVLSRAEFWIHNVITPHVMYGPQFYIIKDPEPYNSGYLYTATLVTNNPKVAFVDKKFLAPGTEMRFVQTLTGEFDQELPGLPTLGDKIKMFESLGAGNGVTHSITGWADDKIIRTPRGQNGEALDIMVYMNRRRGEKPVTRSDIRWEPFIDFSLRKHMLDTKVSKMIWAQPGSVKSYGSKQEVKKSSAGVYHRMKYNGNYLSYPRGSYKALPTIFRTAFGDLFYRRVDVSRRKVKIYTNEAGFDAFDQALKADAFNSGLTFTVADGNRFVNGQGQNLQLNYAFNSMVTRETGEVTLVHLKELDLPQTNLEVGQNKKSTPIFIVFDISPDGDGTLKGNIREVRLKGRPNMTFGYIDGRRHHLGAFASQGHSAANMFDGYQMFFDDRYDVFIEDLSRTVLIEETPEY